MIRLPGRRMARISRSERRRNKHQGHKEHQGLKHQKAEELAEKTSVWWCAMLLSNDFIGSDLLHAEGDETGARARREGECAIVPIVVRSCRFDKLEVGTIQAILPNGKPIKDHKDRDAAWLEVARQLDRVIEQLRKRGSILTVWAG